MKFAHDMEVSTTLFLPKLSIYELPKYEILKVMHFGLTDIPDKLIEIISLGKRQRIGFQVIGPVNVN